MNQSCTAILRTAWAALLPCLLAACQATAATQPHESASLTLPHELLLTPSAPEFSRPAPTLFRVEFETTKGKMILEVHRDWAPLGTDRFYNLVRAGYYDGAKFSRIRAGYWAQFGIAADPRIAQAWRNENLPDDPIATPQVSNTRGTVAFAFAKKDGRTTQVFINLRDNQATHDHPTDGLPFVPFAKVIEGMDVADHLNTEYGENAGGGIRGGKQDPVFQGGNAYLEANFPRLDGILHARILP